jgi:putative ABC transport system permease protein
VPGGFATSSRIVARIVLPDGRYGTNASLVAFGVALARNLAEEADLRASGFTSTLPIGDVGWGAGYFADAGDARTAQNRLVFHYRRISPSYFSVMNIPLLRGRYYNEHDDRSFIAGKDLSKLNEGERLVAGVNVIIIDEEFAKRYWPGEEAVGKRIKFGTDPSAPVLEVVGVVGRVKMEALDDDSNRVQGYFSFAQVPFTGMTIVVKGNSDPNQLIAAARNQVRSLDSDQPIYNIRTMDQIRGESVAPQRLNLMLLSIFAGIAFVLAIVGIYGVMSYAVTQRTHEIGIRMAIGAQPRDVFRMILGQGMLLTIIGMAAGLVGAFALTRLMATMLFSIKPTDPLTFATVAVLLVGVALIACYIPGRRATKVDPVNSLRYE